MPGLENIALEQHGRATNVVWASMGAVSGRRMRVWDLHKILSYGDRWALEQRGHQSITFETKTIQFELLSGVWKAPRIIERQIGTLGNNIAQCHLSSLASSKFVILVWIWLNCGGRVSKRRLSLYIVGRKLDAKTDRRATHPFDGQRGRASERGDNDK